MNGDALEIMTRLGEIHADLKQDIGNVKTEMAGFKGGIEVRVATVEATIKDDKFWGNVKAAAGPFTVALHMAAHKLGWKI